MADEAEKNDPGCKPPGKDSGEPIRTERKRQLPGSWINAAREQPVCGMPLCQNINDIEGEPRLIKKIRIHSGSRAAADDHDRGLRLSAEDQR